VCALHFVRGKIEIRPEKSLEFKRRGFTMPTLMKQFIRFISPAGMPARKIATTVAGVFCWCAALHPGSSARADQTITINGTAGGRSFDGIGAVSGGGATSVLLKDYPEPQRGQILDLLFKPDFGAAMSTLFVEVPGDGNSTQGSELSHMHYRNDENYNRGYEWWLMQEARKRNPAITLDGVAWGCPNWVGNNNFWSQDMCDYYAKWIKGLKNVYGLDLDAIGCRNEKGVNEDFVKKLRRTLDGNGLEKVRIHAFDNWGKTKWDWCKDLRTDAELRRAVAIISNHTMTEVPVSDEVGQLSREYNKPLWNTEEHVYKQDFDCEISLVKAFNENYVGSGVTKVLCWYLETSTYPIEPFFNVTTLVAASPWSGNYTVNPALWAYAHYGQFVKVGWKYLDGACGRLSGGGSYVTLASGADYSIIIETKGCAQNQKVAFNVQGGLSTGKVCVWRSNDRQQFVKVEDLTPVSGSFSLTLEPNSIYSLSTITGQQKGSFNDVPAASHFPFPYYETFDHYGDAKSWGYLPHYTADIDGGFEITSRPDGLGKCLRQVVDHKAQSWAPEWMPYTIIGDENWQDYEVSADVCLDEGGWAGLLGRVNNTGGGYGCNPKGYYLRVDADGHCFLYASTQNKNGDPGRQLAAGQAGEIGINRWHNLKLQFSGTNLTALVDQKQVLTAGDGAYAKGMAGLVTGGFGDARNSALFDNLIIKTVNGPKPAPTVFPQDAHPLYVR
jgi:galactosylceramidase